MRILTKDGKVITLEEFNPKLWTCEKQWWQLLGYDNDDPAVFNVGSGNCNDYEDDQLRPSPLFSRRDTEGLRQVLWAEIKKYLSNWDEICEEISFKTGEPRGVPSGCLYLQWIVALVRALREHGYVRLVYTAGEHERAETIAKCVAYVHEHYIDARSHSVVIFGSQSITRLCPEVERALDRMISQNMRIYVGDAPGASQLMIEHLDKRNYKRVTVFYSRQHGCRRALTKYREVGVSGSFSDRDDHMVKIADYGFGYSASGHEWDGRSNGSLRNMGNLKLQGKKYRVVATEEQN